MLFLGAMTVSEFAELVRSAQAIPAEERDGFFQMVAAESRNPASGEPARADGEAVPEVEGE